MRNEGKVMTAIKINGVTHDNVREVDFNQQVGSWTSVMRISFEDGRLMVFEFSADIHLGFHGHEGSVTATQTEIKK